MRMMMHGFEYAPHTFMRCTWWIGDLWRTAICAFRIYNEFRIKNHYITFVTTFDIQLHTHAHTPSSGWLSGRKMTMSFNKSRVLIWIHICEQWAQNSNNNKHCHNVCFFSFQKLHQGIYFFYYCLVWCNWCRRK